MNANRVVLLNIGGYYVGLPPNVLPFLGEALIVESDGYGRERVYRESGTKMEIELIPESQIQPLNMSATQRKYFVEGLREQIKGLTKLADDTEADVKAPPAEV